MNSRSALLGARAQSLHLRAPTLRSPWPPSHVPVLENSDCNSATTWALTTPFPKFLPSLSPQGVPSQGAFLSAIPLMWDPPLPARAWGREQNLPPTLTPTLARVQVRPAGYLSKDPRFQEHPRRSSPPIATPSTAPHRPQGGTSFASRPASCHRPAIRSAPLPPVTSFPAGTAVSPGSPGSANLVHRLFNACFPNRRQCSPTRKSTFCFWFSNFFANFCNLLFCRQLASAPYVPWTHHSSRLVCLLGEITRLFSWYLLFLRFFCTVECGLWDCAA